MAVLWKLCEMHQRIRNCGDGDEFGEHDGGCDHGDDSRSVSNYFSMDRNNRKSLKLLKVLWHFRSPTGFTMSQVTQNRTEYIMGCSLRASGLYLIHVCLFMTGPICPVIL